MQGLRYGGGLVGALCIPRVMGELGVPILLLSGMVGTQHAPIVNDRLERPGGTAAACLWEPCIH